MYYIYILKLKTGRFYTGYTSDLKRRIAKHDDGKVVSTKYLRPAKLIHYEAYLLKSDALRREKFLKTTEGKRLLKQQIRDILKQDIEEGWLSGRKRQSCPPLMAARSRLGRKNLSLWRRRGRAVEDLERRAEGGPRGLRRQA